jgi:hypothetical protein
MNEIHNHDPLVVAGHTPTLLLESIGSPLPVTERGKRSRARLGWCQCAGSVILNFGSRVYMGIFVATENMCQICSLSLKFLFKIFLLFQKFLGTFDKRSKDPVISYGSGSAIQNYGSGSRRPINYGSTGSGTLDGSHTF